VLRCRRKDGAVIASEFTLTGFDDPDLGWCWVTVHRDVSTQQREQELVRTESERLGEALRGLPILAYSADRELRCTLLFDNLIDPLRPARPRVGRDYDLFGPLLADQIANLNRRVLVTGKGARLEVDYGGRTTVTLWVEPVVTDDGEITGLVGSALGNGEKPLAPEVTPEAELQTHRGRGPRGFSRLR
jgi:PAS domain-containing protein